MTTRILNTTKQESDRINIPIRTLIKARSTGFPKIPYIKIGRTVRYDPDIVDRYIENNSYNLVGEGDDVR